MKNKKEKQYGIYIKIPNEEIKIVSCLKNKHHINISSLLRAEIKRKYKELEKC